MIVIWKDKGIWFIYLLGLVLAINMLIDLLLDKQFGIPVRRLIRETVGSERFFGILLLFLPGIPMIVLGFRKSLEGVQRVLEPETGRIVLRRPAHTLYFVNVYYWGAVASIVGLALIFN